MSDREYRDQAQRDRWDAADTDEKLDMIARQLWPNAFVLKPLPKADPLDDLWEPAHDDYRNNKDALLRRYLALTEGCWLRSEQDDMDRARMDYMIDWGQNLPYRYRDEEGRVIDEKRGDITDDLDFLRERDRLMADRASVKRQIEDFHGEAEEQSRELLVEIDAQIADHYTSHGRDLPSWLEDAGQERLAEA